jgi:glycosyltransferase involved in cell wall biosynthesis
MEPKTQSNKKNILYFITKANFGGAQKYVYELACEANSQGHKVTVLVGGDGLLVEKLKETGISVIQLNHLKRDINLFGEVRSFVEMIKLFRKIKPDLIHLNSSKAGLAALAGRLCGINKIIFTIHGWAFNENRSRLSKLLFKKLYFLTILLSSSAVAVSTETAKQARTIPCYFLIKNKIKIIKNGIKPIEFMDRTTVRKIFKEKYGIPEEAFLIGTFSELHPIKGLQFLIEAAAEICKTSPQTNFLILSTGQEKEKLTNLIAELGLKNKVILGGFLKDAPKYLKGFDLFIMTSLSEALPLSLLEAGSAEIPIISTNVGGIPEIITDGQTGILIKPGISTEIVNAINSVLEENLASKKLATNLKNKIDTEFNFENFYKKTFELYN